MHSKYLRKLFLDNDLAAGRYRVADTCCKGGIISLDDIHATPLFVVSTTTDHIAPWKSVYKISWLANADTTFVLTSGGHNAGIVAPPDKDGREFRIDRKAREEPALDPDTWCERASWHEGSWWPAWAEYLERHSSSPQCAARPAGSRKRGYPPLTDAPGIYVREP
jgi:polyhydroxyalkanoate synthase